MNFIFYKKLIALREISSVLLSHGILSCNAGTSGKSAVRCIYNSVRPRHRTRNKRRYQKTLFPDAEHQEEEKITNFKGILTDEELDEMYDLKFYNSDAWKAVIERQIAKHPKKRSLPKIEFSETSLVNPKKSDGLLCYAAQAILEDVKWWRGELPTSEPEEPDPALGLEDLYLPEVKVNYPFAMVRPANQVSEPAQLEPGEEATVENLRLQPGDYSPAEYDQFEALEVFKETLKDLEAGTAQNDPYDSLLNPDYVERIELSTPYQPAISNKEVERIIMFKQKAMYGSPNPNIPSTNEPCGGCGAILHCQDSAVPGYLPSEMLESLTPLELQDTICQRCNFLQKYDVALNVSVSSKDYIRVISEIQDKNALVLLLVDLLDFPCSIWPGIIDIIGPSRPIVVVGNKVDLLPKDNDEYLDRIKKCLRQALRDFGVDTGENVKHVSLISAKTGYGIEELITIIMQKWGIKGDIYVIGCTNVGKSSLFNSLLQSDLCKSQAVDIIKRATVSMWPGTTLKLLKFPLLNPTPWRTHLRIERLKAASVTLLRERELRYRRLRETRNPAYATLIGHIGMTFKTDPHKEMAAARDPFNISQSIMEDLPMIKRKKFRPDDPAFVDGKWLYDTPGAIHRDQIIGLLTLEELAQTIPKTLLTPRCVIVKPGQTFFLAGLGRIDYVEGETSANFMVFSSKHLPISVVNTEHADKFYEKYLGTEVLKVPFGKWERLKDFPALKPKPVSFFSRDRKECCGDIVLSSAGWVSINFSQMFDVWGRFLAYTPDGRGCYVRDPPLLKYSILVKGKRVKATPFCQPSQIVE